MNAPKIKRWIESFFRFFGICSGCMKVMYRTQTGRRICLHRASHKRA